MATDPPYNDILSDSFVRKKLDVAVPYLLGERNQARRIRDVSGVLSMYVSLGVSCWTYWAFLLKALLLAFNIVAIYFAFCTYKSPKVQRWHFEIPGRIVVWLEFLGINAYLAWFAWRFLHWLAAAVKEARSADPEASYEHNFKTCAAMRLSYKAALKLDFNLLIFLRFISPPAVSLALAKARSRVYRRYGTRTHRQNSFVDCCCCFCFYGRLCMCSALQSGLVLMLAGGALLSVLLKVLQLRFLGELNIQHWSIGELLLFGQFVINMACLDTREKSKRKGKLEFLYHGADAEEAEGERKAKALVENLALLVLRHRYSLLTALSIHHSITAEDISYIYIHDEVEEAKQRCVVRHEYAKSAGGDGGSEYGGGMPTPPPLMLAGPMRGLYDNPEWLHCGGGGGTVRSTASRTPYTRTCSEGGLSKISKMSSKQPRTCQPQPQQQYYPQYPQYPQILQYPQFPVAGPDALFPGQVVVEVMPRRRAGPPSEAPPLRHQPPPPPSEPSAPPAPPPAYQTAAAAAGMGTPEGDPSERFPFDFYTQGRSVGMPLRGSAAAEALKSKYEQHLWEVQGR